MVLVPERRLHRQRPRPPSEHLRSRRVVRVGALALLRQPGRGGTSTSYATAFPQARVDTRRPVAQAQHREPRAAASGAGAEPASPAGYAVAGPVCRWAWCGRPPSSSGGAWCCDHPLASPWHSFGNVGKNDDTVNAKRFLSVCLCAQPFTPASTPPVLGNVGGGKGPGGCSRARLSGACAGQRSFDVYS